MRNFVERKKNDDNDELKKKTPLSLPFSSSFPARNYLLQGDHGRELGILCAPEAAEWSRAARSRGGARDSDGALCFLRVVRCRCSSECGDCGDDEDNIDEEEARAQAQRRLVDVSALHQAVFFVLVVELRSSCLPERREQQRRREHAAGGRHLLDRVRRRNRNFSSSFSFSLSSLTLSLSKFLSYTASPRPRWTATGATGRGRWTERPPTSSKSV